MALKVLHLMIWEELPWQMVNISQSWWQSKMKVNIRTWEHLNDMLLTSDRSLNLKISMMMNLIQIVRKCLEEQIDLSDLFNMLETTGQLRNSRSQRVFLKKERKRFIFLTNLIKLKGKWRLQERKRTFSVFKKDKMAKKLLKRPKAKMMRKIILYLPFLRLFLIFNGNQIILLVLSNNLLLKRLLSLVLERIPPYNDLSLLIIVEIILFCILF